MAEVCKGNVYLTIADEDVEKYMSKGFSVVDPQSGKILQQSIPAEIGPLKKLYSEQLEINKKLTAEIDVLRKKIESLQGAGNKPSAPEDSTSWDDWAEEAPKKKKSTKSGK